LPASSSPAAPGPARPPPSGSGSSRIRSPRGRAWSPSASTWLLTGNAHQIADLATKGFYLGAKGSLLHSENLALVDGRGHLRGFYDPADPVQGTALLRDMSLVMAAEARRREKAGN
jgi:hypothetical protein